MTEATEPKAPAFDLSQEAILMRVVMTQGNLSASSREVARDSATVRSADEASIYGGIVVLRKEDRAEIVNAMNTARSAFYMRTLPWDDGGYRLCPLKVYSKLTGLLTEQENKFTDAVDVLVAKYPDLKADYEQRVNGLAATKPFPSEEKVRGGFSYSVSSMPLGNPNDVRLKHIDPTAVDALKAAMNVAMTVRLQEAQGDIIDRLKVLVKTVKERCESELPRFYDSLVNNINEAVEVLPSLNVTGDKEIDRLINRVKREMGTIDLSDLRNSRTAQKQAATTAASVLDDLKAFSG